MPTLLRLRDSNTIERPYTVAQFRQDRPDLLSKAIALLETDEQRQYIISELLGLSQRCNLPNDFIAALQTLIQSPPE